MLHFLDDVGKFNFSLEPLTTVDILRIRAIAAKYPILDFVDCCIVAIAERLNITQICTFDHRDFRMIRPAHVEYFELLP